jgi:Transketolase, thiamine diphosphate binding domain
MSEQTLDDIRQLAAQLRVDSIRCSTSAGSGHPTSSMSAADLMAVLLTRHFRYDWQWPGNPANDHLIFSKGHASPLLYSMFKAAGVVSDKDLIARYRRIGSALEGHLPRRCRGSTSRPARSARGCPTALALLWPAGISTRCHTASGCYAATARWPRAPCGRRSTRRCTTG